MKDKLIGLVFLLVLCVGAVVYATREAGISLLIFVSLSSFVFVAGFGGGLTYTVSYTHLTLPTICSV